jgi:Uncharacterized conserved protein (DUF2285)/Family of unknown function (DUF6499)
MPTFPKTGTAWAKCLEDYACTRNLDRAGWAWEFLRRNRQFCDEFKSHGGDLRAKITEHHAIHCIEMGQRNVAAEKWHLLTFASLDLSVCGPHIFWDAASLPQLLYFKSKQAAKIGNGNFDLNCIAGQKSILRLEGTEYVVIQRREKSVRLAGTGCSLISGSCDIKFEIAGLIGVTAQLDAIKMLARFTQEDDENSDTEEKCNPLFLSYLIALDGHLEGKTYRQIAQVIYGEDRVSEVWTSETRFMKDKVRRAVERGIAYMEGEYLTLLH